MRSLGMTVSALPGNFLHTAFFSHLEYLGITSHSLVYADGMSMHEALSLTSQVLMHAAKYVRFLDPACVWPVLPDSCADRANGIKMPRTRGRFPREVVVL